MRYNTFGQTEETEEDASAALGQLEQARQQLQGAWNRLAAEHGLGAPVDTALQADVDQIAGASWLSGEQQTLIAMGTDAANGYITFKTFIDRVNGNIQAIDALLVRIQSYPCPNSMNPSCAGVLTGGGGGVTGGGGGVTGGGVTGGGITGGGIKSGGLTPPGVIQGSSLGMLLLLGGAIVAVMYLSKKKPSVRKAKKAKPTTRQRAMRRRTVRRRR